MRPVPSPYPIRIDLFSDTLTLPSMPMREAIASAELGDEQKGEDPTTNRLLDLVRDLVGKDEAVFLPSGTMCNEIAFAVHCKPGDEMFLEATTHPINAETGGPAALAGVMPHPIYGERGIFTGDQLRQHIRPPNRYSPMAKLLCVEQTAGGAGGACWTLDQIEDVTTTARDLGMKSHMDGARLLNAVVASGVSARDFAAPFDSVWIDLSKGLGCPVGGVLAGDADFIDEAWRVKQRMGGSMRQSGIIAAAGVYALNNNIDRLAEDHENALLFAEQIADHPRVHVDLASVETNMVMWDLIDADFGSFELKERMMRDNGIRISTVTDTRNRIVTHLDISRDDVLEAAAFVRKHLG